MALPPEKHQDVELLEGAPDSRMAAGGAVSVPGRAKPQGVRCQASAGAFSDQTLHVLLGGQVCSDEGHQLNSCCERLLCYDLRLADQLVYLHHAGLS